MSTVSVKLDLETRLQVSRFLGSLVPFVPSGWEGEEAPLSSLFLTLSLVVGSIIGDLSVVAEHTMKSERIVETWSESRDWSIVQGWIDLGDMQESWKAFCQRIAAVRQSLLEMYGESGKVRQGADRFLLAVEGGKGKDR